MNRNEKERKYFRKNDIDRILAGIGQKVPIRINAILIGGGAMSFKGDKEVTKDVDVVITDHVERNEFLKVIRSLGFRNRLYLSDAYRRMDAGIFVNADGFQIDVFSETVCKRFIIRDKVIKRTTFHGELNLLSVRLLSDEDIFLSKSVTERDKDLDDMFTLFRKGLDEEVILSEVKNQTTISGSTLWGAFLARKLNELEEMFGFYIPWKNRVEDIAVGELENLLKRNGSGNSSDGKTEGGGSDQSE